MDLPDVPQARPEKCAQMVPRETVGIAGQKVVRHLSCGGTLKWVWREEPEQWHKVCLTCGSTKDGKSDIGEIVLPGIKTKTPAKCESCATIFLCEQIEINPSGDLCCPFCNVVFGDNIIYSFNALLQSPSVRQRHVARCIEYRKKKANTFSVRLHVVIEISDNDTSSILEPGKYVYVVNLPAWEKQALEKDLPSIIKNLKPSDRSWKLIKSVRDPKIDGFERYRTHIVSVLWTPLVDMRRLRQVEYVEYRRDIGAGQFETIVFIYAKVERRPHDFPLPVGEHVLKLSLPAMVEDEIDGAVREALRHVSFNDPGWIPSDKAYKRKPRSFLLNDFGKIRLGSGPAFSKKISP